MNKLYGRMAGRMQAFVFFIFCAVVCGGAIPDDFNYTLKPVTSSADTHPVIGTTVNTDVSTMGAATLNIPIASASGHGAVSPQVAVAYSSQAGNGIVGYGCNISGLSVVTRVPGDIYHDGSATRLVHGVADKYSIDGQRLILTAGTQGVAGSTYKMESDPASTVSVKSGSYGLYFTVTTADGRTMTYGNTASSRQDYRSKSGATVCNAWYLNRVEDALGNYADYTYTKNNNFVYIYKISYGLNKNVSSAQTPNEITFAYESRSDIREFRIENVVCKMAMRLKTVTTTVHGTVLRKYTFNYNTTGDQSHTKFSRLVSVVEANGSGAQLKPVKIVWDYLPSFTQTAKIPDLTLNSSIIVRKKAQMFISADMNGDGISDLIEMCPVEVGLSSNDVELNNYCYIYPSEVNADGSISFSNKKQEFAFGASFEWDDWREKQGSPIAADLTGDGIVDLIVPNLSTVADRDRMLTTFFFVCGDKNGGNRSMNNFNCVVKKSDDFPLYTAADLDGDGKSELLVVGREPVSGASYTLTRIYNTGGYSLDFSEVSVSLGSKPSELFSADFNGDGLNDIIFFYGSGYKIFFNRGDANKFSNSDAVTGTSVKSCARMSQGDFNGDGLTDFLTFDGGTFNLALSQGDGTFNVVNIGKISNITSHKKADEYFSINVYDIDHDGKSDVVINAYQDNKATVYWLRSTGAGLTLMKTSTSTRKDDALACRYAVGDFNGDGMPELFNYGYDCYSSSNAYTEPFLRVYGNAATAASGKVVSFTDCFDNSTAFTYSTLSGDAAVYSKGSGAVYPMVDVNLPLPVVKKTVSTNGAVGSETVVYKYSGLKGHMQGKGLLGMTGLTVNNQTQGTTVSTNVNTWNNTFYIPSKTTTTQTVGGATATAVTSMSVTDKGKKVYAAYPSSVVETDFDGNTATTTYNYDTDKGQLTNERTEHDDGYVYKDVSYGSFVKKGGVWLPQIVDEFIEYDADAEEHEARTTIVYDDKGRKTAVTENSESSMPVTTRYTYDAWGNILSSYVEGKGIDKLVSYNVYDVYGDNIVKKHTSPASAVNTFEYDALGNLTAENDETDASAVLTTKYTYDGWGRLVRTESPTGKVSSTTMGWGSSATKKYYVLGQAAGEPWVKTWYDSRGREVLVESVGAKDVQTSIQTTYDAKGRQHRIVTKEGDLSFTENFTYDQRGRVSRDENVGRNTTTYSYGNRSVTTTLGTGRSYTKAYNAWGDVVSASDPVNTVTWQYGKNGKPTGVSTCGNMVGFGYDDVGNRTSLSDPDAGTTTYTYDAAGRETLRKDARGKTVATDYDVYGHVVSTEYDGVKTSYTYGTSGSSAMRLTSMVGNRGNVSYGYDNYGRVSRTVVKGQGNNMSPMMMSYEYNANGAVTKAVYPGTTINYDYDCYGNMTAIRIGGKTVWQLKAYTGSTTQCTFAGGIVSGETRNKATGLLSALSVTKGGDDIFKMSFGYEASTGNLLSREGMFSGVRETFGYDNLDRLVSIESSSVSSLAFVMGDSIISAPNYNLLASFCADSLHVQDGVSAYAVLPRNQVCTYSDDGNILSINTVGQYAYESSRPHAVTGLSNIMEHVLRIDQTAEYDGNGNITLLTDGRGNKMEFVYGPDGERWMSRLYKDNSLVRTIVYADGFDVVTEGNVSREFYYPGNGVLHIVNRKGGTATYFMITDNLGSIVRIVDENGNSVFEASYDAWGKQTVTKNDIGFYLGYTGHEMLTEFNLVNMNGRVYDPLLGRFLSPDNFVQAPDNSQSFNRYSYCLNNPLKYTDPSGEYAILDDVFSILLGGVVNLGVNLIDGNIKGDVWSVLGKSFAAFGAGAINGWGMLYPQFGGCVWGGAVTGATNSWLAGQTGWNIVNSAAIGGVTSFIVGKIGELATSKIRSLIIENVNVSININSPLLKGMILGSAAGGVSNGVGCFVVGFMTTGNLWKALDAASHGLLNGVAVGAISGGVSALKTARQERVSPWTGEDIQRHHSYQKALGGPEKQPLTDMSKSRHKMLHKELNEYLRNQTDGEGHHMRPQKGNPGARIRNYFDESSRINALKNFYDSHPLRYWDARYDFYRNTNMLNQWQPFKLK